MVDPREPGATSGNSIISWPIATDFSNQFVVICTTQYSIFFFLFEDQFPGEFDLLIQAINELLTKHI